MATVRADVDIDIADHLDEVSADSLFEHLIERNNFIEEIEIDSFYQFLNKLSSTRRFKYDPQYKGLITKLYEEIK